MIVIVNADDDDHADDSEVDKDPRRGSRQRHRQRFGSGFQRTRSTGLLFFEDRFFDSTSASSTFLEFLLLPPTFWEESQGVGASSKIQRVSHNMVRFRSQLKTVLLFLDSHFSAVL